MPDNTHPHILSIGVLIDSMFIPAWAYYALEKSTQNKDVIITTLIVRRSDNSFALNNHCPYRDFIFCPGGLVLLQGANHVMCVNRHRCLRSSFFLLNTFGRR